MISRYDAKNGVNYSTYGEYVKYYEHRKLTLAVNDLLYHSPRGLMDKDDDASYQKAKAVVIAILRGD